MKTKQLLEEARARLVSKGWLNYGNMEANDYNSGKRCVVQAIWDATDANARYDSDHVKWNAVTSLFREVNRIKTPIPVWNDDPERTFEDVLEAFDKAILVA